MSTTTLAIKMTADGRAVVVEAKKVEDALQGVGDQAGKTGAALQGAGTQAGKTGAALQSTTRASEGVNAALREMDGAGRAAGQGMGQAQAMGAALLAGLRDQIATFGKSAEALLRHRAAQLGVGQEAASLILQLQNQRAAQTQAAQAAQAEAQAQREAAQAKQAQASAQASFLAGLRDQVAVQGLSTADTLRYRAAQLGVADGAESYIAALSSADRAHKMGAISAGEHSQALKYLPMQFTDVAVSIASGMPIWMVAIQQGGQIKDSFGGVGVAAREMGRYVLGLLNPFTLTAAAMAVWAAGAYAGSQEARALQLAIIDSGNAAGVTQGQLMGMAAGVDAVVGTQGRAVEVLAALVATGQVGAAQLEAFTVAAVRLESVGGAAAEETAGRFAELGKAPLQASLKLNESMNYLTASTYRQIKALMDQGRTTDAARVAQVAFADTLADRTGQMEANLGIVERGWRGIKSAVTEAWDAIKAIGRDAGPEGQLAVESDAIAKLQAQIEQRKSAGFNTQLLDAELAKLRERQSVLQSDVRLRKSAAEAQAGQVKAAEQLAAWDQTGAQYASAQQQREAEIRKARVDGQKLVAAGLLTEAELAQRIAAIQEKHSTAATSRVRGLTEAEKALREEQKRGVEVVALRNKLVQQAFEEQQQLQQADRNASADAAEAAQKAATSLQDQANAQRQQNAAIGLTREAVTALEVAKLREQATSKDRLATIADEIDWSGALGDSYRAQAAALRELAGLKESGAASQAVADEAKGAADEWKRFTGDIERGLTDSLFRAFDAGKDFFRTLWDGIRNMFKSTVLKLAVQAVVGSVTGALGMSAANAATGAAGGSSLIGTASNIMGLNTLLGGSGMLATASGAVSGFTTAMSAAAQSMLGITGTTAQMTASLTAAGHIAAPGMAAGVSAGSSVMSTAAAAGPYVLAAVVALNALGVFRSNKVVGSGLMGTLGEGDLQAYDLNRKGGTLFSGPDYSLRNVRTADQSSALQTAFGQIRAATAGMADQLGLAGDSILTFTTRLGSDLIHPDTGGYGIKLDGLNPEQAAEKIQAALAAASDEMAALLLGTTQYTRTGETASATLARLSTSLNTVNAQFDFMGATLLPVSLRGASAASALADALGGLEAAGAKIGAYYANFYGEAEQAANTTRALTTTLGALGYALPDTREGFRALVEAQDLTTERGRATYATLMSVQDAFASLTPSAADLATQLGTVTEAVSRMFDELRGQIGTARAAVASGRETITGGPAVRTFAQIQASIAATSAAATPSKRAIENAQLSLQTSPLPTLNARIQAQQSAGAWLDANKTGSIDDRIAAVNALLQDFNSGIGDMLPATLGKVLTRQVDVAQAFYDKAVASTAAAQAAVNAGQQAVEDAQLAYAQGVTAWVAASTLSAEALGTLKDETLAYYAQQKALADAMRTSAAGLRTAVAAAQLQTLTDAQSLSSRLGDFAQNYSLALATTGATKAGYADKMAGALPQLSADLAGTASSRVDWAVAVARLTSQSQAIADQLDAGAPATYEAESLTLLDAIDGKLASMNTAAESLQVSLTAAVNNGANRTAAGLSNLIKAVQGDSSASLQAFATGGVFTNSVVNSPTVAPMALFGEAGPEAIMPLTRGPGGSLGVQVYGGGGKPEKTADDAAAQRELVEEIKRLGARMDELNKEVQRMRQENNIGNSKIADSTDRSARLHERWATVGLPATEAADA